MKLQKTVKAKWEKQFVPGEWRLLIENYQAYVDLGQSKCTWEIYKTPLGWIAQGTVYSGDVKEAKKAVERRIIEDYYSRTRSG